MKAKSCSEEWMVKGENDLLTARILFKESGPTDTLCFHCQQAVEKYLKAFLANKKIYFKKIHDLRVLANLCAQVEKRFLDFLDELKILDAYYIESRYPPAVPVYSKREAKEALEMAEEIIKFIKRLLRKRISRVGE